MRNNQIYYCGYTNKKILYIGISLFSIRRIAQTVYNLFQLAIIILNGIDIREEPERYIKN